MPISPESRLLKQITATQQQLDMWPGPERERAEKRVGSDTVEAVIGDRRYVAVVDAYTDAWNALDRVKALIEDPTLEMPDA